VTDAIGYMEWRANHYTHEIELVGQCGFTNFCVCNKCAALVYDSGDALEHHVKWHENFQREARQSEEISFVRAREELA
jgi:hypothetical protein